MGELCNSLSALAGNMVEKVMLGDDVLANPNVSLSSVGIGVNATLTVTFSRPPRFHLSHVSDNGDEVLSTADPTMLQRVFRTIDVPFLSTPFGLELEVGVHRVWMDRGVSTLSNLLLARWAVICPYACANRCLNGCLVAAAVAG